MKIAIIGSPERRDLDSPLVEEAKLIFDDVSYFPITEVKLKISEEIQVLHKDLDISFFDVVLPIPTFPYKEFYYATLRILEKYAYTPIQSENFFNLWNRTLLLKKLSENGIRVRKTFSVASHTAASTIISQLKLPLILEIPEKSIFIRDETTLRNVLSIFEPGRILTLKKPIKPKSMVFAFVVGDEVVASYEKIKNSLRPLMLKSEAERLALKIKNLISSDFCVINFLTVDDQTIVNQVSLSPDFPLFQKITSKNVCKILLTYLNAKARERRKNILDMFVNSINDFVRWFTHEVRYPRSTEQKV